MRAWINNHFLYSFLCDVFTHPCLNFYKPSFANCRVLPVQCDQPVYIMTMWWPVIYVIIKAHVMSMELRSCPYAPSKLLKSRTITDNLQRYFSQRFFFLISIWLAHGRTRICANERGRHWLNTGMAPVIKCRLRMAAILFKPQCKWRPFCSSLNANGGQWWKWCIFSGACFCFINYQRLHITKLRGNPSSL